MLDWINCPVPYSSNELRAMTNEEIIALATRHPNWLADVRRDFGGVI